MIGRIRNWGYFAHRREGRVRPGFEVNLYTLPLPRLRSYFEGADVTVCASIAAGFSDPVASVSLSVTLPGPVADRLDWLLPDQPYKGWMEWRSAEVT